MTHAPTPADPIPSIHTPCPKRWDELIGDQKRRFCSECRLHVHNGAELTRVEASTLAATSTERVCMRLELDASGHPIFRDSKPFAPAPAPRRRSFAAVAAAWIASTAAGLLAACARNSPPPAPEHPPIDPGKTCTTNIMGKVKSPELLGGVRELMGDTAVPPPPPPAVRMGEVSLEPDPQRTEPAAPSDPR